MFIMDRHYIARSQWSKADLSCVHIANEGFPSILISVIADNDVRVKGDKRLEGFSLHYDNTSIERRGGDEVGNSSVFRCIVLKITISHVVVEGRL